MNPVAGLAIGRIVIGLAMFVAPRLAARLFQLDGSGSATPYIARLFASREIALGAATLATSGETRNRLVTVGVAVDAADGVAAILSNKSGDVGKIVTALLLAPAAGAVAVGLGEVVRSRSQA
ncbi:hypothetical protein [Nocardioides panacisoli]|uniref:DUF4267 domain-containing protein n=1 Tax=Nocardioides panacisoli TaxID=627624 RepID=A0ABP7IHV7_9ACTN